MHGPTQRQQDIAEIVLAEGSATAADLAARFGVSAMTIYRDLDELERQGIVRKYRGGVTAQPSGVFESNVAFRKKSMQLEKEALAERAVELVEPGMSVLLDDSTTALALARLLPGIEPLTVVTNFLETINLLAQERGIHLMALGGDYDPLHNSFLGVTCVEAIQNLRVDLCFLSTSSVTGGYAFHQEQHIVSVKRAMIAAAGRKVLMVDHTKLQRTALHRLCPLSTFDIVLIDDGTPPETLRALDESGVRYEVASRKGDDR